MNNKIRSTKVSENMLSHRFVEFIKYLTPWANEMLVSKVQEHDGTIRIIKSFSLYIMCE